MKMSEICSLKEQYSKTNNKCQNMVDGHKDCLNCVVWQNIVVKGEENP